MTFIVNFFYRFINFLKFFLGFLGKSKNFSHIFDDYSGKSDLSSYLAYRAIFGKKPIHQKTLNFVEKNSFFCFHKLGMCRQLDSNLWIFNRADARHMYYARCQRLCRQLCVSWTKSGIGKKLRLLNWIFSFRIFFRRKW